MMRLSQGRKWSRKIIENKYTPPVQTFHAMVLLSKDQLFKEPVFSIIFSADKPLCTSGRYELSDQGSCPCNSLWAKG